MQQPTIYQFPYKMNKAAVCFCQQVHIQKIKVDQRLNVYSLASSGEDEPKMSQLYVRFAL